MLYVAGMRIIFYTNGTITALSNDNENLTCDNVVRPNADTISTNDKS